MPARGAEIEDHVDVLLREADAMAVAIAQDPGAPVRRYPSWTLTDLAAHVGRIHGWVTRIVADRVDEPQRMPATPDLSDEDVPAWLRARAVRLAGVLRSAEPDEPIWTFSPRATTCGFWQRRMALETVLHRWDAEDAVGAVAPVDEDLARDGLDEVLHLYVEERLQGKDVGGAGQRVGFDPGQPPGWTMTLHPDHVEVEAGVTGVDATVRGSGLDLWLLLSGRREIGGLTVAGDRTTADLAVAAACSVPGPA